MYSVSTLIVPSSSELTGTRKLDQVITATDDFDEFYHLRNHLKNTNKFLLKAMC